MYPNAKTPDEVQTIVCSKKHKQIPVAITLKSRVLIYLLETVTLQTDTSTRVTRDRLQKEATQQYSLVCLTFIIHNELLPVICEYQ
jgi:hypothetical protein